LSQKTKEIEVYDTYLEDGLLCCPACGTGYNQEEWGKLTINQILDNLMGNSELKYVKCIKCKLNLAI
jgi:hypothetical protein